MHSDGEKNMKPDQSAGGREIAFIRKGKREGRNGIRGLEQRRKKGRKERSSLTLTCFALSRRKKKERRRRSKREREKEGKDGNAYLCELTSKKKKSDPLVKQKRGGGALDLRPSARRRKNFQSLSTTKQKKGKKGHANRAGRKSREKNKEEGECSPV